MVGNIITVLLILTSCILFITTKSYSLDSESLKGPYLDSIKFIHYLDENVALEEIRSGNLDIYYFRIPLDLVPEILSSTDIILYDKVSGTFGLLLNPAPGGNETLNPFEFREVRYAMNYLINRNFISNEILQGYGFPLYDSLGIFSPDYPVIMDIVESYGFYYDPEYAFEIIKGILEDNGAIFKDNKWYFKDKPITLKVLIRSDDQQRKILGELISSELSKAGFTIIKDYGDLNKSLRVLQNSDPQQLQWHLYTEAFTSNAFSRYNDGNTAQFYAPWYANMPGYQNPGYWQYQNTTLDDVTQKLVFSNFTSELERNNLLKYATKMGIEESVRIFLVNNIDPFAASSSISGLVNDFGGGITNKYSLLNAQSNKTNSLNIGVKQIYQGAWNSVGGFSDTYSTNIYSNIADSSILRHPFTGEVISMRNDILSVTTLGPYDKLEVDPQAIIWDSKTGWTTAGENSTSLSKVTYKILYSNWHHGIPMDKADLLYSLYFMFEWGSDDGVDDLTKDPEYTSRVKVALPLYKGFKFVSDDTVESFIDIWHFDKNEIAGNAGIWPQEPWEITAATERLVLSNLLSYSKSQAITKNADWLSLIIPEHANLIKKELIKMKDEKFIPLPLKNIVTVDEALKRYDASIKWIEDRQHAVISNGPFFLDTYNPSGRTMELKAFRDNTYPFEQGYWSNLEKPKTLELKNFTHSKYIKIGEEKIINFQSFSDNIPESNLSIFYFLLDYSGNVIKSGEATRINDKDGSFSITLDKDLTKNLTLGPVTLKIFANTQDALRPVVLDNLLLVTP